MSTEIEVRPGGALAISAEQTAWTDQQIAVLRSAGVSEEVTPAELDVFLHECQRTKLDPFSKQIYLIGRYDGQVKRKVFRSQTGIDGYRVVAHRVAREDKAELEYEDTLWCGPDGEWRDVWLAQQPPAAAKVVVFKGGKRYSAVATLAEYAARYPDGNPYPMWKRMPANQLEKCAEAKALRRAFPNDLGGIYTAEEMEQADARDAGPASQLQVAEAVELKARRSRTADPDGEFAARPAEPTDVQEIAPEDEGLPSDEVERQRRLAEQQREPWESDRPDRPSPTAGRGAPASDAQIRKLQAMMSGWSGDEKHGVLAVILGRPIASQKELTLQDATVAIDALNKRRDDLIARIRGQAPVDAEPGPAQGEQLLADLTAAIETAPDRAALSGLWSQANSARGAGMLDEQQFAVLDQLGQARAEELAQPIGSAA